MNLDDGLGKEEHGFEMSPGADSQLDGFDKVEVNLLECHFLVVGVDKVAVLD